MVRLCRLLEQDAWARKQASEQAADPLWSLVSLLHAQLDGLHEGYNARVTFLQQDVASSSQLPPLTITDFLLLSAVGALHASCTPLLSCATSATSEAYIEALH